MTPRVEELDLPGLLLLTPTRFGDERGFFSETWRADAWPAAGVDVEFVQDNHSRSRRGTIRGLHFQTAPGQAKLVRVARGAIVDVVVDVRRGSPTYGRSAAVPLDDDLGQQLFVPIGFAHGFQVVSDVADVMYRTSWYYVADTEKGVALDDPALGIEWPLARDEWVLSERDRTAPLLADVADSLPFTFDG